MDRPARPHIVVIGSINTDYSARAKRLPRPGETARADAFWEGLGGKGANQAVAAARLGARVTLLAKVGADARGRSALDQVRREGVDVDRAILDPDAPTGAALIAVEEGGEKQILMCPGANARWTSEDLDAVADVIRSADVVMAQLEVPVETVLAAFRLAKEAGRRTVLDPAPAQPLQDELYRLTDVIKPNAAEAEVLTEIEVRDRATARRAADVLLRRGVGLVAVPAGEEGNLLVSRDEEHWLPRISVKAVDATGAGDAFVAAVAWSLAEGRPLGEAGRFASVAAALSTTKYGAQPGLPTREEVERTLASA